MPIECSQLEFCPAPFKTCPKCKAPFAPFMRGMVQRSAVEAPFHWLNCWWKKKRFQHVSVICQECKNIVGYEHPEDYNRLEDHSPEFPWVKRADND